MFRLNEIYRFYINHLNFRFVYILEAHAEDEWPISSSRWCSDDKPIRYNQTRTLDERLRATTDFRRDFQIEMPLVIDRPDSNLFEQYYAPWPVRIYLIDREHRLIYKAQPSEAMLELKEFQCHLESIFEFKV
jgi:hypothetical protein